MVLELLLDASYKDAYSLDFHKFLRPRALISKNNNIFGGIFQDFPIKGNDIFSEQYNSY